MCLYKRNNKSHSKPANLHFFLVHYAFRLIMSIMKVRACNDVNSFLKHDITSGNHRPTVPLKNDMHKIH